MMKTLNRTILAVAAASMAVLPVAAQAGTRAGDSGAVYSVSAPGAGRSAEGESIVGGGILFALLAAAAAAAGLLVATGVIGEGSDDAQSPGD